MTKRYQVLARKYRPQAFKDVVGQDAAVVTLKNAIRFSKVAHAYLFCGTRGVGKTTLARLFAKALNCQSPTPDLEPCNQCPSCVEIVSGQSLDVIEIDGASNRGIDDIRQINETIGYAPSHGKYKIYIIDEVHMLTKEAFNALLKTLEEPPERAKFFFATTEAHKVLPTIISRCQRFDLARIQPSLIANKLQQIAQDLERQADPDALTLIANFAEGSLRDAESLFDQILCFEQNTITTSIVRQSLGLVPVELFHNLDQAFTRFDLSYAFTLVEELFQTGKDLAHFLEQLIEHYRNITLARTLNTPHPSAKLYTQSQTLFILDLLIQAESQFQKSTFQRISLESLLLQIIRSKNRVPIEVLVRKLTDANAEGKFPSLTPDSPEPALAPLPQPAPPKAAAPTPEPKPPHPVALQPELKPEPPTLAPPDPTPLPQPEPPKAAPSSTSQPTKPQTVAEKKPPNEPKETSKPSKHPSHYDTLVRFASIELEGSVKI